MTADQVRALYKQYGLTSGQAAGTQAASTQARETPGPPANSSAPMRKAPRVAALTAAQQHTPRVDVAVVWKLRPDKTLEPVRIRTGITDHTVTEVAQVLNGQLNEGDELVTGGVAGSSARDPGAGPGRSDAERQIGFDSGGRARRPSTTKNMATIPQSAVKTPGDTGDHGLIQIDDVHKYYDLGETRVHALARRQCPHRAAASSWPSWAPAAAASPLS